jgi:hypothetical protein
MDRRKRTPSEIWQRFPSLLFPPLNCQLMSSVNHVEFWAFTLSLSCLTDLFVIAQSQFTGFKDPRVFVCRSSYSKVFPS